MVLVSTPIVPSTASSPLTGSGQVHRRGRRVVRLGEVDQLLSFGGDAHAREDHIELSGHEVGNHVHPVVDDPVTFQVGAPAHLVAQLAIEAVYLAPRR